jgi:hypothetical protein
MRRSPDEAESCHSRGPGRRILGRGASHTGLHDPGSNDERPDGEFHEAAEACLTIEMSEVSVGSTDLVMDIAVQKEEELCG